MPMSPNEPEAMSRSQQQTASSNYHFLQGVNHPNNRRSIMASQDDSSDIINTESEVEEEENGSEDDMDMNDDEVEQDEDDEDEDAVDPSTFLINVLKRFEERGSPLSAIILTKKRDTDTENDAETVPSLQAQSIISIINNAPLGDGVEPVKILVETCEYLIQILQDIYRMQQQNSTDATNQMVANTACMDALCEALTSRTNYLPISMNNDRRHCFDGCNTVLSPPNTSMQSLSRLLVEVEDHFKHLPALSQIARSFIEDGGLPSVDELRYRTQSKFTSLSKVLDHIMIPLPGEYSFEDCYDAVFCSNPSKQDYTADELIRDYAAGIDSNVSNGAMKICAFAGVAKALEEHKRYHTENEIEECVGEECDGHGEYEEAEPETVHGWSGSWTEESDKPKKNSFCYGIKMGCILEHANEYARATSPSPPKGSSLSSPRARFHQDMSEVEIPSGGEERGVATAEDFVTCRARHGYVENDAFEGDADTIYSSMQWTHDGKIGFSHVGGGWKNREFRGHIYSFDDGRNTFESYEMCHEFWRTPSGILADGVNETVWIDGDRRIKGFGIENGQACTKYIFNVLNDKLAMSSVTALGGVQSKRRKTEDAGNQNLIAFGSSRLGYLNKAGIIQEWKLNDENQHDGIRRMVNMDALEEDLQAFNEEDILNLSESTWMDEMGAAEVTRGKKPDSIRQTDVVTPYSIGYLPNEQFAFVSNGRSEITMYDYDLREKSRLVGFGTDKVDVVQRPTFEKAGDPSIFVASDSVCAKIFDLRSGKAEMTIHQRCVNSVPVYLNDSKFVCNRLSEGKGAMMWDLRLQRPMYSLPISGNTDLAWIPSGLLLAGSGEFYKYGRNPSVGGEDLEWEIKSAESAWSELEKKRNNDRGVSECSIM